MLLAIQYTLVLDPRQKNFVIRLKNMKIKLTQLDLYFVEAPRFRALPFPFPLREQE